MSLLGLYRKLQRRKARKRLCALPDVDIDRALRVSVEKIRMAEGCRLTIGKDSIVEARLAFDKSGSGIQIGARTFVGASSLICAESITIGDDVLMSWGCTLVDHDSHALEWEHRKDDVLNWGKGEKHWEHVSRSPIRISDRAWIGFNAVILKGVTVGEGAVVAAGSVVAKNVPAFTLVAGNPAREMRKLGK